MAQTVWVIESGEYEQRGIDGVAVSPEAAVAYIKARYGPPYVVEWAPVRYDDGAYELEGSFEWVPQHSARHVAVFEITAYEVAE